MSMRTDIPVNSNKRYPLLPYSQLVFDMMKTEPDVYWYDSSVRIRKSDVDIRKLKQAIETALRNHPALSMVVNSEGMQHYEPQQDIFHGQYYSIDFREDGNYNYIYLDIKANRILGDAQSALIIYKNIFRAYRGEPIIKDDYVAYLEWLEEYKQSEQYATHKSFLEQEFDADACQVHPQTDTPIQAGQTAVEGILIEDMSDFVDSLSLLQRERLISHTAFFSLCATLAIMDYNDTDQAALTWAYIGRDNKLEENIYGSLHCDVPMKICRSNDMADLFRQVRSQMRLGIAHSSYPYTLTKPHTYRWNYAVNVLQQPSIETAMQLASFPFEVLMPENDKPQKAYSLLDIEIYNEPKLTLVFRYSATHYKRESMQRFANMVRKNAKWLIGTTN